MQVTTCIDKPFLNNDLGPINSDGWRWIWCRRVYAYGARSVLRTAKSKDDQLSQWVVRLAERSHGLTIHLCLVHFGVAFTILVLGRTGRMNDRRIDHSTLA